MSVLKPTVVVRTREQESSLFNVLEKNTPRQSKKRLAELCAGQLDRPESVGWLADSATHIIRVYEGKKLVTFAYVDTQYSDDSVELILICGRYRTGGMYPWKGSELIVDKVIQLARMAGKKSIRLEALNQEILDKVYKPMGFKDVEGEYLKAELPITGGSRRLRLNKQARSTQRNARGHKGRKLRNLPTRRR